MALVALLVVLLGLPSANLTAGSSTDSAAARQASLRITQLQPLRVTGYGFRRSERVSVTANGRRKVVIAGVNGSFTIAFRFTNSCGATIVARGSEGSRASLSFDFSNVHCLEIEPVNDSRAKPTLKLSNAFPLTVRGANFRPGEHVRVTVTSELKRTKSVVASSTGVFLARFQSAYQRCAGIVALAVGERGSRAVLRIPVKGCPAP